MRARSSGEAASTSAGSVASRVAIMARSAATRPVQNRKSDRRPCSRIAAARGDGGGGGGRPGTWVAGTSGTSARQRCGWRMAKASAESAPAEPPITATRSSPSASSRSASASACAAEDGSAGKAERR